MNILEDFSQSMVAWILKSDVLDLGSIDRSDQSIASSDQIKYSCIKRQKGRIPRKRRNIILFKIELRELRSRISYDIDDHI